MWILDVAMKVWMRGRLAWRTPSQEQSMSFLLARDRPQITGTYPAGRGGTSHVILQRSKRGSTDDDTPYSPRNQPDATPGSDTTLGRIDTSTRINGSRYRPRKQSNTPGSDNPGVTTRE